jgi:ADP-heptose:LPS heptosyltransferase
MKRFYLEKSGGLGDVFWSYYLHDNSCQKSYHNLLKTVKKSFPDSHVTFLSCTDNRQVAEFLSNNPLINQTIILPMSEYKKYNWQSYLQNKIPILEYVTAQPVPPSKEFWLSPEEIKFAKDVASAGKFITIHPFGGSTDRTMVRKDFSLKELISTIIDLGYYVILVGGNDNYNDCHYKQEFTYLNQKCINLINQFSCRLHAHFTAHSDAFIGVSSCFSVIATIFKIRSLIYYPISLKWWQEGSRSLDLIAQSFRNNNFHHQFFEQQSLTIPESINKLLNIGNI